MANWIPSVPCICLVLLADAVRTSSRRFLSLAYALGGILLVLALGAVAAYILVPRSGGPEDVNPILDMIGAAVILAASVAAVYGAYRPARRVKG
ncbi:MAG TPA: hypothetical protein VFW19_02510 [Allosphingosinicella sp.]|nr:hypothetical protein [Allosphingosinicella sp.]